MSTQRRLRVQGCEVSPFLRGTPPGPVKTAYIQGVSLTRAVLVLASLYWDLQFWAWLTFPGP